MKKLVLFTALMFGTLALVHAQTWNASGTGYEHGDGGEQEEVWTEYKKKVSAKVLKLVLDKANMEVEGYNGSEIVISSTYQKKEIPERAQGLQPLYRAAEDNTGLGLNLVEEGGTVTIMKAVSDRAKYKIKVPKDMALSLKEANWNGGDFVLRGLTADVEIHTNGGNVELDNVTGPVVLQSTSGDVILKYGSAMSSKPTSISTVSGFIDVTLATSAKTSLNLRSMSGEVYTNMEIEREQKAPEENLALIGGGGTIEGTTNGGGVEITLNTISGDIYLRKK